MTAKTALLDKWKGLHVQKNILAAFEKVPREAFIAPSLYDVAYEDRPLPTLRHQTLSQPTTVIMMLSALDIKEGERVFEVGTGVGYQAALLSHLVGNKGKVITMEIVPELVQFSRLRMAELGRQNVNILEGDGSEGDKDHAPFDRIIITAAAPTFPQPLLGQLKNGGVIVAPLGDEQEQTLVRATKRGSVLKEEFLGPFLFVPMRGKYGFKD